MNTTYELMPNPEPGCWKGGQVDPGQKPSWTMHYCTLYHSAYSCASAPEGRNCTAVKAKYGPLTAWKTQLVTDMTCLFGASCFPNLAGYDQFNEDWSTHYGAHMANFIRDVRKDLNAPKMPFVIGQVGFDGTREEKKSRDGGDSARTKIKKGQLAMASIPTFRGNVAVVKTDRFWDQDADAIYRGPGSWKKDVNKWHQFGNDRPYHYLGSPWFFAQTGTALGEAMVGLLK